MPNSRILRLVVAMLACWTTAGHAQNIFNIANGDVVSCSGAMVDSGGEGGPGYGNNEQFTATICPDQPGDAISLNTVIFNLNASGTAPGDELSIYDGATTGDPLIGTWTSGDSPGIITASFGNPTGCLTISFTSNETGTGAFAFSITCFVPCEPPVASAIMSEPSPALICQGEAVQFDGSGSTAPAGFNVIQWTWDFGDGVIDSTSGPVISHVFPDPASGHVVHLMVEDDNGCVNTNSVELEVRVSTTPTFSGMDDQTICVGETAALDADAQAVTWSGQPVVDFGDGLALPDELGVVFTSSITMSAFQVGQTLTDVNDIVSVCIDMEHSFMGDFVLQLTSPTGETMVFHQQGGGGTYLGIPVDDESQPNAVGTCYTYCFSPTATNGTWVDNAGGTLPAGTYESLQPFSNLLGSQLNGTWTVSFTDLFGLDNGFICSWWIEFNPALLPDVTAYTPVLDINDPDSSGWSGAVLTTNPLDPSQATFAPTTSGPQTLTYSVTDNFGCTYDTTLTVNVNPAANVEATATPPEECGDPWQLNAALQQPIPQGPVTYYWTPTTGLNNSISPYPFASPDQDTWYVITAFPSGHPLCGTTDSVLVNGLTWLENDSIVTDAICHGDGTGHIQVVTTGNGGPWNYSWMNAGGTVVQTTMGANGDNFSGAGGTWTVVVSEGANGNNCSDTLQAVILEPSAVEMVSLSDDTLICRTGTATLVADVTGGTGSHTVHWSDGATGATHAVGPLGTTTWEVWATDSSGCMSDTLEVEVAVRPPLGLSVPDTVVTCFEQTTLLMPDTVFGGDGAYQYAWAGGTFTPDPGYTAAWQDTTLVCLTVTDGCETPDVTRCVLVAVKQIPDLVLTADTTEGCDPFFVIFNVQDTTGGATVTWNFGDGTVVNGPPAPVGHTYMDPGVFDVKVTAHWPNGCDDDSTFSDMIIVAAVPDAQFTWSPNPASTLDPTVHFAEQARPYAVMWSWDLAGLDTAMSPDPVFVFPNDVGGHYPVQLVVANYLGCTDTIVRTIEVMDEFLVFVPTAFTPDGDGVNEQLFVLGDDIDTQAFVLNIFNRWGQMVFSTEDRSIGWDGTFGGKPVPDGVYNWKLEARSLWTGISHKLSGHVSVLR